MFWRYTLLLIGVFACSTAIIQIKFSHLDASVLAASRLLLAAVLLAPMFWKHFRANPGAFTATHFRRTWLPSVVLAVHFLSWTYGARLTLAAQASLIVNLAPIAIPFFLHSLVGERINQREIIGTLVALTGVVVLTAHDAFERGGNTLGNIVCFFSMLLFAWYLALGRKNRDFASLWLYLVPVYLQAGLICLVAALPSLRLADFSSSREWLVILGLALLPTIVGHSLLNFSMRHLRGQVVSLCNVGQFIFATIMAYLIFGEQPTVLFFGASVIVVAGVALVVFSAPTAPPRLR